MPSPATSSLKRNIHDKARSSKRPPLSPRSTLTEVLRANPFRANSRDALVSTQNLDEAEQPEDPTVSLNHDVGVLATIFPDVQIEVIRELLNKFEGDSRLQLCTDQLWRYKTEWARGRMQNPPRDPDAPIPKEQLFRTDEYSAAVKRLLCREFASINRSAVEAVLAEVNASYTKARPILKEVASRSWRVAFTSLFRRKKDPEIIPLVLLDRTRPESELLPTGSPELDEECAELFVRPMRLQKQALNLEQSIKLARKINVQEATDAGALFECQVCYNDVPFEDMTACTAEAHIMCLDCVRKSLHEAIFGQSWARSVTPSQATLRCLAPVADKCEGHIPVQQLHEAIRSEPSGNELWSKFEDRLTENSLLQSQLPLKRCPFCAYAEVEQRYTPATAEQLSWRFRPFSTPSIILLILLGEFILPTALFIYILLRLILPTFLPDMFHTSLAHLANAKHTTRFRCRHPQCSRASCTTCSKPWHDPHVCHEPLVLSLRQSVEAARTAAVKRVCPRCGTAFVKSSGCNKLTCVCGYSMCYLCRKNIGKTGNNDGAEGYRHFCEHFRPVPGQKCTQCERCDLYKAEDEDAMVKMAGEAAEKEWRVREGMVGVKGFENAVDHDGLGGLDTVWVNFCRGTWTVQGVVDGILDRFIMVEI